MGSTREVICQCETESAVKYALTFIGGFVLSMILLSFSVEQKHIRTVYHESIDDECQLQTIAVSKSYGTSDLTRAYQGFALSTSADFAFLPTTKWTRFSRGRDMVEAAIKSSPNNPEIRYIRIMIQTHAPAIVDYRENINEDLEVFEKNIGSYDVDEVWKSKFVKNMLTGPHVSEVQKKKINSIKV